jgi:hypothetical protein
MMPPRGLPVWAVQATVAATTDAMLAVSETSQGRKWAVVGPSSVARLVPSSSFMSRIMALPPAAQMSRTQARPRPEALGGVSE